MLLLNDLFLKCYNINSQGRLLAKENPDADWNILLTQENASGFSFFVPKNSADIFIGVAETDDRPSGGLKMQHKIWEVRDLNIPTHNLFDAITRNDIEAAKSAVSAGADLNCKIRYGSTPLMKAASFGYVAMIKTLLDAGVRIDCINTMGQTALTFAIVSGNADAVELLCLHGAEVNRYDYHELLPVETAWINGKYDIVDILLQYGADVHLSKAPISELLRYVTNRNVEKNSSENGCEKSNYEWEI